jgi:hypothetical protein
LTLAVDAHDSRAVAPRMLPAMPPAWTVPSLFGADHRHERPAGRVALREQDVE